MMRALQMSLCAVLLLFVIVTDSERKPAVELKAEIKTHYTGEITVVVPKGEDEEKKEAYLGPMVLKFIDGRLVSAEFPPEKEP